MERRAIAADVDACLRIVRGLQDFFTDDVPERIRHDLANHEGWVTRSCRHGSRLGNFAPRSR